MYGHPSMVRPLNCANLLRFFVRTRNFKICFIRFIQNCSEQGQTVLKMNQCGWTFVLVQSWDAGWLQLGKFGWWSRRKRKNTVDNSRYTRYLLIDEVIGKSDTIKKWKSFLEQTTRLGIALFWTCRPYEWNTFQNEMHPTLLKRTLQIELPQLQKEQCKLGPQSSTSQMKSGRNGRATPIANAFIRRPMEWKLRFESWIVTSLFPTTRTTRAWDMGLNFT